MNEAIRAGQAIFHGLEPMEEGTALKSQGGSFADLFKKALNETSDLQGNARTQIEAFLRGEPVELHQLMAATEEASISLELLVEIRNKLTDAYRTLMNVQ